MVLRTIDNLRSARKVDLEPNRFPHPKLTTFETVAKSVYNCASFRHPEINSVDNSVFDSQSAEAYIDRGDTFADAGDFDNAIADYTEALRLNPQNTDAFNNRGLVYVDKGDLDNAIADYSEAIRLEPTFDIAYSNRGIAYRENSDFDNAMADFAEALRLNPQDAH